jgi:putative tryptophan/tyrosine transport system substrate-binding protein
MKRRQFITLIGGAAAAWPLAARAQQPAMRRIGFLDTLAADDLEASVRYGAFLQGLQALGWAVGRNLRIDARWAAGDADRIRRHAAELGSHLTSSLPAAFRPFDLCSMARVMCRSYS